MLRRLGLTPLEAAGVVGLGAAMLLMRPGLLGEKFSLPGVALTWVATSCCVVQRGVRLTVSGIALLGLLVLTSCWFALSGGGFGVPSIPAFLTDLLLFVSPVAAAVLALGRAAIARALLGLVVLATAMLSAFSIITLLLTFASVRIEIFSFVIRDPVSANILFPFTPTASVLSVFGISVPRFTGLGREPGWMAMLSAVAFFTAPVLGRRGAALVRPLLVAGVVTPISTAGFGVFVVVLAARVLLSVGRLRDVRVRWILLLSTAVLLPLAAWGAVHAPIVGLDAKSATNAASLAERSRAYEVGIAALQRFSLGGVTDSGASAIDLIAAVATNGWPFLVLAIATVCVPVTLAANREIVLPASLVIALTLLTAQPTPGSTDVFILLVALLSLRATPSGVNAGGAAANTNADSLGLRSISSRSAFPRSHPRTRRLRSP